MLDVPFISDLEATSDPDRIIRTLYIYGTSDGINCVNWPDKFPYHPLSTFTIAHDGKALYIDFFVRCNFLRAENYLPQSPVSQDSCVEFFVAPKCDRHYWNFEFNCIGTINASHRTERANPTRLSPEELGQIKVYPSIGTRPFCELEGLFTWNLPVVIPLQLIGVEFLGQPLEMAANFYKCASATSMPHYLSWQPIHSDKPDFHRPEYFGRIRLLPPKKSI